MSRKTTTPLGIDDVEIVDYDKTKKPLRLQLWGMQSNGLILVYTATLPIS